MRGPLTPSGASPRITQCRLPPALFPHLFFSAAANNPFEHPPSFHPRLRLFGKTGLQTACPLLSGFHEKEQKKEIILVYLQTQVGPFEAGKGRSPSGRCKFSRHEKQIQNIKSPRNLQIYINFSFYGFSSHVFVSFLPACKRKEEQQQQQQKNPNTPKKPRLVFTDLQRRTLQAIFKETKRPSKEMQITISQQLGLELSTVGNFFMNARRRSQDKWQDTEDKAKSSHLLNGHHHHLLHLSPTTTT
ncbi:homeobox protein onecut [Nephila pilipes]|uniref:Homeobox protein onecut n=1 Tax=Nephila pilipes TaxID=299642 RepID=A0A8X6QZW8_NEPPI|nr:homeobox protein onecut [Nephila pilipes]